MPKTQKELAFLRDLYITDDWTRRFTELADKHISVKDAENLLYINAGTGNHCFALREKIDKKTAIFGSCEDKHILAIARDKAAAVRSDVEFSVQRFEHGAFDAVIADASLVRSTDVEEFIENGVRATRSGGKVSFFLPSAGSFGEVFSLLWEVLFFEDLGEHGAAVEALIEEIPTVSRIEEIAGRSGLRNIHSYIANEVFEYKNGTEFVNSPLVTDFLLPERLKMLNENEKERVMERLAQLIDAEDGTLTFRFSVKATLLTGEKGKE